MLQRAKEKEKRKKMASQSAACLSSIFWSFLLASTMAELPNRSAQDENSSTSATKGAKLDATDLCYSIVNRAGKRKCLLNYVSFSLEPGDLCALMGPSGAGKSTLLDLLAARKLQGMWSGEVYVDEAPRVQSFGRETAYVLQDDVHIPTLTVEETIRYAARTKLPDDTSRLQLENRVKLLLDMMGLGHVKDSRIGDGMTKGISGGQVKRLSIAVQIVHLPRLIFLDEPTSGLDSSIALEVMSTVRNIITIERTCVCTIHQPSREIFALFDKLVLVSGGRLIFFGAPSDAVAHFTAPELGFKFDGGFKNPADFLVDISCGQLLAEGLDLPRQPEELEGLYKNSRFCAPSLAGRAERKEGVYEPHDDPWGLDHSSRYVTSLWTQSVMLVERTWVAKIRDTADMKAQLVKNVSLGLILGILYYNDGRISGPFYVDGVTTPATNSVNSFLFVFVMITMVANLQSVPFLCGRMHHYKRELASNAYAPFPFWISSLLVLTPILLFFHCIPAALTYGMMGFNSNAGSFLYFLFISYLGNMVSVTTAMALGANAPSESAALILFPAQFLVFSTFSGFVIRISDLPSYWQWMPYVSYPKWVFQGLMVNEWKQYDTDARSGNGDVLGDYSFNNFQSPDAIWISLLFALGFSAVMYMGLLPPVNRLVRVADASEASLREGGGGAMEGPAAVGNPMFNREPRLTVDSSISANAAELAKGCRLVFRDVQYSVTNKADGKSELSLLKGVTGRAMPGEMVALMGASGAGKSTLLDVLAQRKSTGKILGEITYNGSPEMKSSAYVMQDNVHIGVLTVRESIYYAAELRMNPLKSKEAKARRVEKIIDMLGLQKVVNTILGTRTVRGVSGGQAKRVSIGVEIVNLPNLMFLDEPTTGLDSSISLEVMSAVRNLANQNRTVICTIHQPSEDTYALFDTLLLLAEGRVIYFGPAASAVDFFTQSPYRYMCRPGTNPADFAIAVGGSFLPAADGRYIAGGELATYYSTTDSARSAAERLDSAVDLLLPEQTKKPKQARSYRTDTWFQLSVLLRRKWVVMQKDPFPTLWPIVREFAVGLFYGTVFFQLDTGDACDESCYQDRMSLLYFGMLLMLMGQLDNLPILIDDRLIYYRERGAKAYSPLAYYLSTFLFQLPLMAVNVLCYSVCMYPMTGLRTGASYFGYFFLFMLLSSYCSMLMTYMCAALAKTTEVALGYFPAPFAFNLLYAGYLVFIPAMEDWQKAWMPYLSYFRFAFQGLVLNEFQDNDDLPDSHFFIQRLGFNFISVEGCAGLLLIFMGFFAVAYYLAIRFVDFEER